MEMKQTICTIEDMLCGAEGTGVDRADNVEHQAEGAAYHANGHFQRTYDRVIEMAAKPERPYSDRTRQQEEAVSRMQGNGAYE